MPKNWYSIKAAEGAEFAEVNILDYIGAWGVNAQSFLAEIRAVKAPKLKVFINSPGGSVFEALAIFNGLRASKKEIEVHVLGVAASAASYIAMAGDRIVMPANTYLFIHRPINAVYGNADDMRDMAELLDKIGAGLEATYAKRWKGEEAKLTELLAAESYLTAAECLDYGLCDEVTDEITAEAAFDVEALPEKLQTVFHKAAAVAAQQPPAKAPDIIAVIKAAAKQHQVEAYVDAFATDAKIVDEASAQAAVEEAVLIAKLADLSGFSAHAGGLIRGRKSVAEARNALSDLQTARDEATRIDTAPKTSKNTNQGETLSPLALWDEIHAMTNGSRK